MPSLDQIASPGTEERDVLDQIDLGKLPRHIAIIMDGNGRWAEARRLSRIDGHRAGVRRTRETVEMAAGLGIQVVTLYAFSTENWRRPRAEVKALMGLLKEHIGLELDRFASNNLQLRPIGRLEQLDRPVRAQVDRAVRRTADCTGPVIQIALNYSGRQELTDMVRAAVEAAAAGELKPHQVGQRWIEEHLCSRGLPDPDLVIRTSGEQRLSNFLLWQIAHSEIYFTPVLWPDFSPLELLRAVREFQRRRFGTGARDQRDLPVP
jgi:undecaprenyl diphosphate synthase